MIKMILAVDQSNAIGWQDGRLPWKIPADMERFKELTTGHDILMGYNTFKSLNRPDGLPNRRNFVVTKNHMLDVLSPNVTAVRHPAAWIHAHQEMCGGTTPDLWVIGGAKIYGMLMAWRLIDEIHLTMVHSYSGADVKLPFDLSSLYAFIQWQDAQGIKWNLENLSETQITKNYIEYNFMTLRKAT